MLCAARDPDQSAIYDSVDDAGLVCSRSGQLTWIRFTVLVEWFGLRRHALMIDLFRIG